MSKIRLSLALISALALLAALPAFGLYISDCPQKCTPTCPCSLTCLGPLGPTTCGQAGQQCTGFADDSQSATPVFLFAPDLFIAELDEPSEEAEEAQGEDKAVDRDLEVKEVETAEAAD